MFRSSTECTHCGRPYIGGGGRRKPGDDPDRYRIYKCSGSDDNDRVCPGKIGTVYKRVLEPIMVGLLGEVVSDPAVQVVIRKEVERYLQELRGNAGEEKAALATRKQKLQQEKSNLVDAIAAGVLTTEDAKAKINRLRDDLQEVEERLTRLRALPKVERDLAREADRLAKLAADFPARAKELRGPALRELLKPWIEDATFDKETRELTLTVKRVPATGGTGGTEWQPNAGRVHFAVPLPAVARGSGGRFQRPEFSDFSGKRNVG